jgi:CRISPR-associated protein Csb2
LTSSASESVTSQTLHYVWAISDDEWADAHPHAELLCGEARHLTALGWGVDQAVAHGRVLDNAEVESLSGQRWRAWNAPFVGRERLRVPEKGSLDDLGRAYEAFLNRLSVVHPPKAREPRVFGTKAYLPIGVLPPRPYAAFELPEDIAFRREDVAAVAAMLRSLACRSATADSHKFPGGSEIYVAGHIRVEPALRDGLTPPRFSYLPLPTIGHEYADGLIRRVVIAEPFGGSGSHAEWAQQRLRNQVLRDHDNNDRGVLLDLWRNSSAAILDKYVGEHENWSSVTPVILPGFDDGKRTKAEKLFLQALRQAGLPLERVASFTLRKAPFWSGSQHPNCYRRPEYLDSARNRRFSVWHAYLSFREPMAGPLSIGAGRHCGLGVFAARG